MRSSRAGFTSCRFDSVTVFVGISLIVHRSREQRKLDRIDQGPQKLPGRRDVIFRDMIQEYVQFVADRIRFGFRHLN